MTHRSLSLLTASVVLAAIAIVSPASAQQPDLAGRWTLNRPLSQFPKDVGFGMDIGGLDVDPSGGAGSAGRGAPPASMFRESEDEALRREQLVEEVRLPSPHLTIGQTAAAVTITDESARSWTFHPDGREEVQPLERGQVVTTARWVAGRLEIRYQVQRNRELRYTYSRSANPDRLTVQVQFVERGGRDVVTRVYEPSKPGEAMTSPRPAAPAVPPAKTPPPQTGPGGLFKQPPSPQQPPTAPGPGAVRGPDAELRGITKLGVVVEELPSQAATCGLKQAAIEALVSKSLTDTGLQVARNSDEDTYVYVRVMTTNVPGLCVSRYDVSLFSYATTTLSYQSSPVLAQVALIEKGGLAGGAPAAHGDAVMRSIKQYVDEIASRIRAVNR